MQFTLYIHVRATEYAPTLDTMSGTGSYHMISGYRSEFVEQAWL